MKPNFLRRRGVALITLLLGACGGGSASLSSADPAPAPVSATPLSVNAWVLSGDGLDARRARINGLAMDTTSIDAISRSASALRAPVARLDLVGEVGAGVPEDAAVDFRAAGKAVSPLFHGVNIQWHSKYFLAIPAYRALVKQIRVDLARFPGGQERVRFDASAATRPDDELGQDQPYQFRLTGEDVRHYIDFCREAGIEAEIEVNLHNDDPAMAVALVDYVVNTLKYDLKYVSMGNEPEINNFAAWSYLGAKTKPEALRSYMARYQRYAKAIRAVKPDVTLVFGELANSQIQEIATNAKDLFADGDLNTAPPGALSFHWYLLGDYGQKASDPNYPTIDHLLTPSTIGLGWGVNPYHLESLYPVMRNLADSKLGGGKLFIGEFGASWSAVKASAIVHDSIATVLFAAEAQEGGKRMGYDSLQWFGLSDPARSDPWNPSLIAVDGDSFSLRPQYYLYFLYKHLWGAESVAVSGKQRDDMLSVYAAKTGDTAYLMLINRSATAVQSRVVRVRTASGERTLRLSAPAHAVTVIQL